MELEDNTLLAKARSCLKLEITAIEETAKQLDSSFAVVIRAIRDAILSRKKLIFAGVGKNAHICNKLVGTFNSIGTPACFLDPGQAQHGDLGLCTENDLLFMFSNSGETEELLALFPVLLRIGVKTVAITSNADSQLADNADFLLTYKVSQEACPLNLAPTASTTAALALGDALAMVYLEIRGLGREEFAKFHPAGSLGKSLLLRVSEIMRSGNRFACLPESASVQEAIMAITKAKCGTIALTNESGILTGVFSDGDFRRCALGEERDFLRNPVVSYMTRNPKTIQLNALAVDALKIFEDTPINDLVVVDKTNKPVGIVDGQDLPKLRII